MISYCSRPGSIPDRSIPEGRYRKDPSRPVIVTLPRSGRNWLLHTLEGYYQKPIAWQNSPWFPNKSEDTDFFLVAAHDLPPIYHVESLVFLYRRDIVSSFSSWALATQKKMGNFQIGKYPFDKNFILQHLPSWRSTFKYYIFGLGFDRCVITYEDLFENMESSVRDVVTFLNRCKGLAEDFDIHRFREIHNFVDKEYINYHAPGNISNRRLEGIEDFRNEYELFFGDFILEIMIDNDPRMLEFFNVRRG